MSRQVKQLNDQIKRVTGENENLYNEVRTGQEQLRLSNTQNSKLKIEIDEYKLSIEQLNRKTQNVSTAKISEYESKIALFSQEIERLNSMLQKKNG